MNDSGLPFILTVIIGAAIISMVSLFAIYTTPDQKEGAVISVIEKSESGYVLMWENGIGPIPLLSPQRMHNIATGAQHACSLSNNGQIFCWGQGREGQLGTARFHDNTASPTQIQGGGQWQSLTAGSDHACAITAGGLSLCWGNGTSGQLGTGDFTSRNIPTPLETNHTFITLSAGDTHTCGIDTQGLAWCWGDGSHGQLGDGSQDSSPRPIAVAGDLRFIDISAGYGHTCALAIDGTVWCWGKGDQSQIGDGDRNNSMIPTSVQTTTAFKAIAAGDGYSCGLSNGGQTWCWGRLTEGGKPLPFPVDKGPSQNITAGRNHACVLKNNGIWCFSMQEDGTGIVADQGFAQAVHITPLDRFQAISTREDLLLAIVK